MMMRDSAVTKPNYKSSLGILTCEMPVMPRGDSLEFQHNFGAFLRQAQHEPVEITRHGRRKFVLMSADQYDWLKAAAQRTELTANAADVVVDALERAEMDPEHAVLNDLLK